MSKNVKLKNKEMKKEDKMLFALKIITTCGAQIKKK